MTDASKMPEKRLSVLVTGASGQLGRCLADTMPTDRTNGTFLARDALDITDETRVSKLLAGGTYQFCINCAAYTRVDLAETSVEEAFEINAVAAGKLAATCREQGTILIHLSTDYVYHNAMRRPLRENDPTQPKSVYARSKLRGEHAVLQVHPTSIVFRTSWLYSEYGNNFVKTMLRLADEGRSLRIVNDQVGCPTYCRDLARAIWRVVCHPESGRQHYGVYNCANSGSASWYDFARAIMSLSGRKSVDITGIATTDYPVPAARPPYSVLDTSRLRADFGISLRPWQEALHTCLKRLQES